MTHLRQGAWINAHTGQWSYIDEHANWAKREGNLERIGLPASIWNVICRIPNDYGGLNRHKILLTVMAEGGIRMRAHDDVIVFEHLVDFDSAIAACGEVLEQIAGNLTRCRFNNLSSGETIEISYADFVRKIGNAAEQHRKTHDT